MLLPHYISSAPVIKQINNDDDLYRLSDEIKVLIAL